MEPLPNLHVSSFHHFKQNYVKYLLNISGGKLVKHSWIQLKLLMLKTKGGAQILSIKKKKTQFLTSPFTEAAWDKPWWWAAEALLIPSDSKCPDEILASARSMKATRSAWVPRRCDICKMWLQYCGHSIKRSTKFSKALVPNTNICKQWSYTTLYICIYIYI